MLHNSHHGPGAQPAPETAGHTLHGTAHYDFLSGLLGLGVNRRNSRMVIELADIQPGHTVLDVGCGTGSLTLTAKSYTGPSGQVYGIDAAPEMIAAARAKAARSGLDLVFEVGLMEQLAFPDGTFDVVISRLAIHHLPDDLKPKAFAEILRVLKPGGRLLIADFTPPVNPILAHIALILVGHSMMRTEIRGLPSMLATAGFVDITSGPTRASFLAFVSGKKPLP